MNKNLNDSEIINKQLLDNELINSSRFNEMTNLNKELFEKNNAIKIKQIDLEKLL